MLPVWFLEVIRRGRALRFRGSQLPRVLAGLTEAVASRDFPSYTAYSDGVLRSLQTGLNATALTENIGVTEAQAHRWILFVESHILMEYLSLEYPRQHGLFLGVQTAMPDISALQEPPMETEFLRQRREEYNMLRRDPPAIRQLRFGAEMLPKTIALMRSEWVGSCVGGIYDFYQEGFNLRGVFEEMVAFIRARCDGSYRSLALPYYREVMRQLDTFLGPETASAPHPLASAWIADREAELWYLFVYHGLEAVDVHESDVSFSAGANSSGSSGPQDDSATDDEHSLIYGAKKGK